MTRFVITLLTDLRSRFQSRAGQSLVEYALVLSFISLSSVAMMSILGVQIRGLYVPIIQALEAVRAAI